MITDELNKLFELNGQHTKLKTRLDQCLDRAEMIELSEKVVETLEYMKRELSLTFIKVKNLFDIEEKLLRYSPVNANTIDKLEYSNVSIKLHNNLNDNEIRILKACLQVAVDDGDNGYEGADYDLYARLKIGKDKQEIQSVKGYLGQLVKKGYISTLDDSYFDWIIVELAKKDGII